VDLLPFLSDMLQHTPGGLSIATEGRRVFTFAVSVSELPRSRQVDSLSYFFDRLYFVFV